MKSGSQTSLDTFLKSGLYDPLNLCFRGLCCQLFATKCTQITKGGILKCDLSSLHGTFRLISHTRSRALQPCGWENVKQNFTRQVFLDSILHQGLDRISEWLGVSFWIHLSIQILAHIFVLVIYIITQLLDNHEVLYAFAVFRLVNVYSCLPLISYMYIFMQQNTLLYGLAQLVATLVRSTKLLYTGPG